MKQKLKYILIQNDDDRNRHVMYFDTKESREHFTVEEIYGEPLSDLDEEKLEAWGSEKEELEENGCLTFEGDPGIEWCTGCVSNGDLE